MTTPAWDRLELNPERVLEVASFFEAYAVTALRDLAPASNETEGSGTRRDTLAHRDLPAG